jgi:succinate dehydrogenase/fumarate reductase flavoprotein subunit
VTSAVETDVVIVGGGAGGLTAAISARERGASVTLLEKAGRCGGTALKAAAWYWVPNNRFMRDQGIDDRREDAVAYMARTSRPELFDARLPRLGLPDWEYELIATFYDEAAPAVEALEDLDALHPVHYGDAPDYFAQLDVDRAPTGRVLVPRLADGTAGNGLEMIRQLLAAATARGTDIRLNARVTDLVRDADGRVTGVRFVDGQGTTTLHAGKAVIFASGGFTHNAELRRNYLAQPVFGGCAAITNEGDFVPIAQSAGAALGNMNYAWLAPIPLEQALNKDPAMSGVFVMPGDSLLFVNRYGQRTLNEKATYNELAQAMSVWDGHAAEYPNQYMFPVWDARSAEFFAGTEYGNFIPPPDGDWSRVVQGDTLEQLAAALAKRLARLSSRTGGVALAADFTLRLTESISQFNRFAETGRDEAFGRGETPIEIYFHGDARPGADRNRTMVPLSSQGPYFATILVPGTLDTKGGPKVNRDGQVLDHAGVAIPGLYGVGNCVASPSARAYWAGGGTLGPILTFGWLAGAHAATGESIVHAPAELAGQPA